MKELEKVIALEGAKVHVVGYEITPEETGLYGIVEEGKNDLRSYRRGDEQIVTEYTSTCGLAIFNNREQAEKIIKNSKEEEKEYQVVNVKELDYPKDEGHIAFINSNYWINRNLSSKAFTYSIFEDDRIIVCGFTINYLNCLVLFPRAIVFKKDGVSFLNINKETKEFEPNYEDASDHYGSYILTGSYKTEEYEIKDGKIIPASWSEETAQKAMDILQRPLYDFYGIAYSWHQVYNLYRINNGYKRETKICQMMTDLCKDKPYKEDESLIRVDQKGFHGWLCRFATDHELDGDNVPKCLREPLLNEKGKCTIKFEHFRLLISDNLATRSCAISRDGIDFSPKSIAYIDELVGNGNKNGWNSNNKENYTTPAALNNIKVFKELFSKHKKLKYVNFYGEKHPEIYTSASKDFLTSLFNYSSIIETLIKTNNDKYLWEARGWRNEGWSFESVIFHDLKVDKETAAKSSLNFYTRLGLTKPLFDLLFTAKDRSTLSDYTTLLHSCMHVNHLADRTQVSPQDLKNLIDAYNLCQSENDYGLSSRICNLMSRFKNSKQVLKSAVNKLDLQMQIDYHRLKDRSLSYGFTKDSYWPEIPRNQEDLQLFHDRCIILDQECSDMLSAIDSIYNIECKNFSKSYWNYRSMNTDEELSKADNIFNYIKSKGVPTDMFKTYTAQLLNCCKQFVPGFNKEEFPNFPETAEDVVECMHRLEPFYLKSLAYDDLDNIIRHMQWDGRKTTAIAIADELKSCLREQTKNLDICKYRDYMQVFYHLVIEKRALEYDAHPYKFDNQAQLDRVYNDIMEDNANAEALIAIREAELARKRAEEEMRKHREEQEKYIERYKKLKKFDYSNDSLAVVCPKQITDLIYEGQALHHCVGSFCQSVSEGRDTILFLRKKNDIDTPYVTISLLPSTTKKNMYYINQAHSNHNGPITEADVTFLKEWAKEKGNVELNSIKTTYGLACHR